MASTPTAKVDAERDLKDCGIGEDVVQVPGSGSKAPCLCKAAHSGIAVDGAPESAWIEPSRPPWQVVALNKCPYGKLKLGATTVLFATYSSLSARPRGR